MLAKAFWGVLLILLVGGSIWGLSRLPRRHKKGEKPITMDSGSLGGQA